MLCEGLKMNVGLTKLNLSGMDRETEKTMTCRLMFIYIYQQETYMEMKEE